MGLQERTNIICYRVALLCYCMTDSVQITCEMHLRVVLAGQHRRDSLFFAGTASGKTPPIPGRVLNALLDAPDKRLVTLVISPLKRLPASAAHSRERFQYPVPYYYGVMNGDTRALPKPGYISIYISSNRPNTMYATHEVVNNIEELCIYKCFLAVPFSLAALWPQVLIFVNNKGPACQIPSYLDAYRQALSQQDVVEVPRGLYHAIGDMSHLHYDVKPVCHALTSSSL